SGCARSRALARRPRRAWNASSDRPCAPGHAFHRRSERILDRPLIVVRRPALREGAYSLFGSQISRLSGDASRNAQALLDDRFIAKRREPTRRLQHAVDRLFAARPKEGGQIDLARLRRRRSLEASERAEPTVRVPDGHHALPAPTPEGGGV